MMPFVSYWDNVLSKEYCDSLINKFEENTSQQKDTILEGHRSFKEINLNTSAGWEDDINNLLDKIQTEYLHKYMIEHKIDSTTWPTELGFEEFRLKKYLPNDMDEFKFHVDVQDWQSASRFLVCFFYLNDVEEGGETAFRAQRQDFGQLTAEENHENPRTPEIHRHARMGEHRGRRNAGRRHHRPRAGSAGRHRVS